MTIIHDKLLLFYGGAGRINDDLLDSFCEKFTIVVRVSRSTIDVFNSGVLTMTINKKNSNLIDLINGFCIDSMDVVALCSARSRSKQYFQYILEFDQTINCLVELALLSNVIILGSIAGSNFTDSQNQFYHMEKAAEKSLAKYYSNKYNKLFNTLYFLIGQISSSNFKCAGSTVTTKQLAKLIMDNLKINFTQMIEKNLIDVSSAVIHRRRL